MNIQIPGNTKTLSVLIDGATGYIATHLIHALTKSNLDNTKVSCLVRKNANPIDMDFLRSFGANIHSANLGDGDLKLIFEGTDIAYHLIGSIAPRKGETASLLHVGQTESFIEECIKAKVKKIIMVSACGAHPEAQSEYHRTKWQAEKLVLDSPISAIILRPSLVIGRLVGHRNSKLITRLENLIREKKFVPLIAGGQNKVQPIFIQDLVEAMLAALNLEISDEIIELGGPEICTLKELVQKMMQKIKMEKTIVDLPVAVATAAATVAQLTQEIPIISQDQIKISQQDNLCTDNKLESLIKHRSTNIDTALNSYHWNL
jgi:NADH dehydrogenase